MGSEQISNNAVYGAKIANDAVGSQHLANNAVSYAAQIKDGIVGYAELTTGLQGSLGVPGPDSIGTTELKEPAVGSANIYNGAVYGTKIKNNAVGSQQLANAGVISTKIANDAVGSQHIANDAIGSSAMIGAGVILGYNLANNTIGSQQLANNSVISTKIANDAVGSQHLANNAVSYAAQIKDGIVGWAELTTGVQGSFVSGRSSPYAGDDSEMTITGTTPGTIKTATVLKDAYVNPVGSIKIAAQLKTDVGTYTMRVQLGTVHKITWEGTDTTYKIWTGSIGVGAESDAALALRFMLVNSRVAGVSSNKLVDIITIQP